MHFRFDFEQSVQAAGCLLELHGDPMESCFTGTHISEATVNHESGAVYDLSSQMLGQ